MKKPNIDRLANALVDELLDKASEIDSELRSEIESDIEHREQVREGLLEADEKDIENSIGSARALLDQLDLSACDSEVDWELEQRVHHARAVLANAYLALYGGFGPRAVIEA